MPRLIGPARTTAQARAGRHRLPRTATALAAGLWFCAAWLSAGLARACDTPVYEYTLMMWQRDPYIALYFYRGAEDPKDKTVNERLRNAARGVGSNANIAFSKVDVATLEGGGNDRLAQQVWGNHRSRPLPFHVVLTPRGGELFAGRLDAATLKAMAWSPKRKQLSEQLCAGKHGLLLLLHGPDEAENKSAAETVRDVVAEAEGEGVEIGFVEVSRSDAAEKWLAEQLLLLEEDLKEIPRPMVFGTFGRGHVLEPYLGRGITRENLIDLVAFMNGPCSCEIKAMSPGMDLLTDWDWESQVSPWPEEYEEITVAEPESDAPADPDVPTEPAAEKPPSGEPEAGEKRPAPTRGRPAEPEKDAGGRSAAPASQARSGDGGAEPARERAGRKAPTAGTPKPGEQPASEQADATGAPEEEARGPSLPTAPTNAVPGEPAARLRSDLAIKLGFGLGGAGMAAAIAGFVLILRRREQ